MNDTQPRPPHTANPSWPVREPSIVSPGAEALGYAGGTLTLLGVLYLLGDVWAQLGGALQTGVLGLATASLAVAAGVVGDDDRIAARLSTTLWLLAGVTGTATSYQLVDGLAGLGVDAGLLAAGTTACAGAGALWHRTGRGLWGAVAYLGGLLALLGGVGVLGGDDAVRATALWAAGAAGVAVGGLAAPLRRPAPVGLTAATAIAAAQAVLLDTANAGLVLGLLTLLGLVGAALALGQRTHWIWAGLAAAVFLPQAAVEWVPDDLAWPLTLLVGGVAMTAACVALVLRRRRTGFDQPRTS